MDLTKEQQEQFAQLLNMWRDDVALFANDLFGSKLRPKQIEFCNAFRSNKRITFRGGVGFGKTHVLAVVTWWSIVCFSDVKVTIFGPNESQLKNGLWNEVAALYEKIPPQLKPLKDQYDVTATRISLKHSPASCYATFMLANKDNVASVRGIHADNNFILVDEATGVADEVFEGALQNHLTTDPNPKLALISNPSATSGFFWRTWNDSAISGMWAKVHGRMTDNPRLTLEELELAIQQYGGKGTNGYLIHVEGEFPNTDDDGLIPSELINLAIENDVGMPSPTRPEIWGVDPSGPGKDRTVIIKRRDNVITEMPVERRGFTIPQLTYLLRDMYQSVPKEDRKNIIIAVDANGLGRGLYDNLREFGLPAQAVTTQSSPTKGRDAQGNSKFAKLRDQLWWEVKEWFATENVSIPYCKELVGELKKPTYEYDAKGAIKVEGKKEMKKRLRMSPDYADALCLTFAVDEKRYVGKYGWSKPIDYGDLRYLQ